MTEPRRKGGRRTKAEEITEFAQAAGVDMELVKDFLGDALPPQNQWGDPPEKWGDWLPKIREILWEQVHRFDGIAAINAHKLIKQLADAEKLEGRPEEEEDARRPLLDRVDALPREHAAALIRQELDRTDIYRDDLFRALAELEGT